MLTLLLSMTVMWGCGKGENGKTAPPATPAPTGIAASPAALFAAIRGKDIEAVKRLVAAGADVNAVEDLGYTPLHVAAAGGQTEIVKLLLQRGAAPAVFTADGITPLHSAAMTGTPEVATLSHRRRRAGADARQQRHDAAAHGRVEE